MKLTIEPSLLQWTVGPPRPRPELARLVHANADRLGTGRLSGDRPILATGHQAFLWHPGILAKDLAARAAADRVGGEALHVVVDQDVHDAAVLQLPHVEAGRIVVDRVRLADESPELPTGVRPPAAWDAEHRRLPASLREARRDLPDCRSIAEQVTVIQSRVRRPYAGDVPVVFASQLADLPGFARLVDAMAADPRACAAAYNRAARANPDAGIAALQWTREMIELPLWRLVARGPRQRVFADITDRTALLVAPDGVPIDRTRDRLAPRALLLTAFMRSAACDHFIHGLGGGVYDRVMEAWWSAWRPYDDPLAPMSVVTADVHLAFDAPVADRAELDRAVWHAHHLRHQLDRLPQADRALAARKRALLTSMAEDRDRSRRAAAFAELHGILRQLRAAHPDALAQADHAVAQARSGWANRDMARRRDWWFGMYPPERLGELTAAIRTSANLTFP